MPVEMLVSFQRNVHSVCFVNTLYVDAYCRLVSDSKPDPSQIPSENPLKIAHTAERYML